MPVNARPSGTPVAVEAPGAILREAARTFQQFGRAVRARPLYKNDNNVVMRQMNELKRSFDELLTRFEGVSIKIRPDALLFQDERVLEEPNPDESIPFAFFRDGIRRIDFARGLTMDELDALVTATAQGMAYSGLGDDIVSFLWQKELEHLHYVVVDTNIVAVGTGGSEDDASSVEVDVDTQIDALLLSIYGPTNDDVGARSVHIDETDIPAKSIADALDTADETAPGFHPSRGLKSPPVYAAALNAEARAETDEHILYRVLSSALDAFSQSDDGKTRELLAAALFDLYDDALVMGNFAWAGRIMSSVRALGEFARDDRITRGIDEAVSETRLRAVAVKHFHAAGPEQLSGFAAFFRSGGARVVPSMLALLSEVRDPTVRRMISNLALEMGLDYGDHLKELAMHEQGFVAIEGVHILSQLATEEAIAALELCRGHADPGVRQAFVGTLMLFPEDKRLTFARTLANDSNGAVGAFGVRALGSICGSKGSEIVLAWAEDTAKLRDASLEIKEAVLTEYARGLGTKALSVLARYAKDGEGKLARKGSEELAIAALKAMKHVSTPGAIQALKRAYLAWNKRVRETAAKVLTELGQELT